MGSSRGRNGGSKGSKGKAITRTKRNARKMGATAMTRSTEEQELLTELLAQLAASNFRVTESDQDAFRDEGK